MAPATDWVIDGDLGHVLDFDGVNDRVDILNEGLFDFERTDKFSIVIVLSTSDNLTNTAIAKHCR